MNFRQLLFVLWVACVTSLTAQNQIQDKMPPELDKVVNAFYATKPPAVWLIQPFVPLGQREAALLDQFKVRLNQALIDYSSIKAVAEMKQVYYGYILVCAYDFQRNAPVCPGKEGDQAATNSRLRVDVYTEPSRRTGQIRTLIVYSRGHLAIPSIANQEPVWFAGRFLHELLHAKQDRDGSPGARAVPRTPVWAADEVEAYDLVRQVLDKGTKGRYSQAIRRIVAAKRADSLQSLYRSITTNDLMAIDILFGTASIDETTNRLTQYLMDIGNIWLEGKYSVMAVKQYKIQNYLTVTNH